MEKSYHVRIPIIALTAHTPGEETTRMLGAGMDDNLTKPLQKDRLLQTMGRLIRDVRSENAVKLKSCL